MAPLALWLIRLRLSIILGLCQSVSIINGREQVRSAVDCELGVPRTKFSETTFNVAGPVAKERSSLPTEQHMSCCYVIGVFESDHAIVTKFRTRINPM